MKTYNWEGVNPDGYFLDKLEPIPSALPSFQKLFQVSATALSRSEERFSRNAETEIYTLSLHDALPIYTLKVKIISVTFRRVIRTNHKKASKIWRHENIQLGGCQS